MQRRHILFAQLEAAAERRRVVREPVAVAVGVAVARFDRQREAHDHPLRGIELVGVALEAKQRRGPRVELPDVERLGQEVVGAGVDAGDAVVARVQAVTSTTGTSRSPPPA